jgi:tripartite-type tricarboxylate transporter receptor subunit TctC
MKQYNNGRTRSRFALTLIAAVVTTMVLGACSGRSGQSADGSSSYPEGPITLVVPFATGGTSDSGARQLATALETEWKTTVTVENRPGGNTVPAVQSVMEARPDGSTILLDTQPSSSMLEAAVASLPFDVTSRTFIATAGSSPMLFIVPANSPIQNLQGAVDFMKKDPTGFTWTSYGGAGSQDYAFRKLFRDVGIDVNKTRAVTSQGGDSPVTAIAGGHVDIGVGSYSSTKASLESGLVRVLAVADDKRFFALPDVPTTVEAGYPDVRVITWIGFSGPNGLPPTVVKKWDEGLQAVLAKPDVLESLKKYGITPFYMGSEKMKEFVVTERDDVNALFSAA